GLVWALSRQLGLPSAARWLAAGLHFTAYPGFHAYLWPIGVQHVLTMLGILAVSTLYLATEHRRRAGVPWRALYWATVAAVALSSLSRVSALVGPLGILVHALVQPGTAEERLRRFDRWRIPVLLGLLYPVALIAYQGDLESIAAIPGVSNLRLSLLWWSVGPLRIFALAVATLLAASVVGRRLLARAAARGPSQATSERGRRAWRRPAVVVLVALACAPVVLRLVLVLAWGAGTMAQPLTSALNSHNTIRWHMHTFALDVVGASLAALILALLLARRALDRDAVLLLVLFGAFGLLLPVTDLHPIRYWTYVTPALAIGIAAAATALTTGSRSPSRAVRAWTTIALAVVAAGVMASNTLAVRLEVWRHKLTHAYPVLDYVRAAELIGRDVRRTGSPDGLVCVNGLNPAPHDPAQSRFLEDLGPFKTYNTLAVLAQGLGRRDASLIRLDCPTPPPPDARVYALAGTDITTEGRSIDPSRAAELRLRALVEAEDYVAARALLDDRLTSRPFVIAQMLEGLPDDDLVWITNGLDLTTWLGRIARNQTELFQRAPPMEARLRSLFAEDLAAYERMRLLTDRVETHFPPPTMEWRQPIPAGSRDRKTTPDVTLLALLGRLALHDLAAWGP
ncbi:MAG TPA: hypothetical protein VML54_04900, partial [Candidatus Limnocylindrales bacterium]|nr:hypothetical protein [Candidatus Limnocylindrales bacterium]